MQRGWREGWKDGGRGGWREGGMEEGEDGGGSTSLNLHDHIKVQLCWGELNFFFYLLIPSSFCGLNLMQMLSD